MDIELIKKENLLQLVLDNIPIYVFWKDRRSTFIGCNKNFAIAAGLSSPEDIIGKNDFDLPWSKEDSEFYRKIDKEVMDSGIAKINFEEPQTLEGNKIKWHRTSKVPLYDSNNEVIGILGTFEDITEMKEMELELRLKNKNLEEANIDLEQFSYAVSHDLQEPLRMMGSFTSLLVKKYSSQLNEEGLEYLGFIKDGAVRMSSMVKEILSYSSINKKEDDFENLNIANIVSECIKNLDQVIKSSNANLSINLPTEPIRCQRERIGMLFNNLISNGIKYNMSENPTIKVDFQEKNEEWLFSITDNGIGIDDNYKDYIFQPFKRLHNREEFLGSGIGLSICKRIVNLHEGKIWIEPNEPQGTIFYFTLKK